MQRSLIRFPLKSNGTLVEKVSYANLTTAGHVTQCESVVVSSQSERKKRIAPYLQGNLAEKQHVGLSHSPNQLSPTLIHASRESAQGVVFRDNGPQTKWANTTIRHWTMLHVILSKKFILELLGRRPNGPTLLLHPWTLRTRFLLGPGVMLGSWQGPIE